MASSALRLPGEMERLVYDVVATAKRDRDPAVALSAAAFAAASALHVVPQQQHHDAISRRE